MEVMVELSVVRATAGRLGRSRSKRLSSSEEKCWASPAEPPLPQDRILPSLSSAWTITMLPCSMCGASSSMACSLVSMLAWKSWRIRGCMSIG
ncbi:hypothetical protein FQZ97_705600 [compost metagenome]